MAELRRALRPDAQAFDEVRIVTVPRYKTSGLSGDEWRISARMQFLRNGEVQFEGHYRDVEAALDCAKADWLRACDDGKAYFAGEEGLCDQEGCAEPPTVTYRKKLNYCHDGHASESAIGPTHRCFCDEHKTRGDCGLDDSDVNYEVMAPESDDGE